MDKYINLQDSKKSKSKLISKIIIVLLTITIILLVAYLFKNIILEILRLTKADDEAEIKEFMKEEGWIGYVTVVVVEALQMFVVFFPAELIQVPAGLSFPFWVALLICDLGICIGASIIYYLVNVLKVSNNLNDKKERKIEQIAKISSGKKIQILMYFLFVTPLIPFGLVCSYASSKKISYRRYILTVATGVIPSIVTSIFMGMSVRFFITESLPLWALVLIIILLGTILFIGMYFISKKFLFKGRAKNSPNSIWFKPILSLFGVYVHFHSNGIFIQNELYDQMLDLDGPIIFLANHLSSYDVYYAYRFIDPFRPVLISNRYYLKNKVTRFIIKTLGFIPKRLFTPEVEVIRQMMENVKKGNSLLMFPEARLSLDGTTNPVTSGTGGLVKKLNIPVVLLKIKGSYLANSKWHTIKRKGKVQVEVERIITPKEFENYSKEEMDTIIQNALDHNEFDYATNKHYHGDKANNLDNVLYMCPKCKKMYSIKANDNRLTCDCGFELTINDSFCFEENEYGFKNIHDYYMFIKDEERKFVEECDNEILTQEVEVKVIRFDGKKDGIGKGICKLNRNGFSFSGIVDEKEIAFSHSLDALFALAFGVNDEYECYNGDDLYYFYPINNKKSCTRVSLIYDILEGR